MGPNPSSRDKRIICSYCGHSHSSKDKVCKHCGQIIWRSVMPSGPISGVSFLFASLFFLFFPMLLTLTGVLAENLIRPIGTLFAVANGSGILPVGRGMDRSAVEWA
ncbi:MAG: zinc ribbon domain-containing protein, partial [Candidatus Hodarchaeales archaeon]